MNRDEILAKSRSENKGADEMAKMAKLKAVSISRAVGFFLCCFGAMMEGIFLETSVIGLVCWMVYWGMLATEGWVLVFSMKTKWGWIGAAANTVLFALFAVFFVMNVV